MSNRVFYHVLGVRPTWILAMQVGDVAALGPTAKDCSTRTSVKIMGDSTFP